MPDGSSQRPSRLTALLTVIVGTVLFFVIAGVVSHGVTSALRRRIPDTLHARVTLAVSGAMLAEIVVLILLVVYLRNRGRSLRELGLWRPAPPLGWVMAAIVTALFVWGTLAGALHGRAALGEVSAYRVYNALVAGIVAGFVEEIFFRGFVMAELHWAGFGALAQVIASAILFGVAHSGWGFFSGKANVPALIGAMISTAALGLAYAITYLASKRSLMPVIAGHLVMDALIEPWLIMAAMTAALGR